PPVGYNLQVTRGSNPIVFKGASCDGCTMDIEIVGRSYRYWRFKDGKFIGHDGRPIGLTSDPRDFFGLAVLTVCMTKISCCGVDKPDKVEVVATQALSKDSRGVFIRYPHGIEDVARRFVSEAEVEDPCTFAIEAVAYIQANVRPGPIDPNLP
ncbi:MAG: hypothetical protein MN733_08370, partial [Nitrososphaera sp.]|nr:hypothetical protein [Nitrososphaera sp.]